MKYPYLSVSKDNLSSNIRIITSRCKSAGIKVTGVIKGCNGNPTISEMMMKNGCHSLGSSRIHHLKDLKTLGVDAEMWLLRIPMISEIEDLVTWCDVSLNSEMAVIEQISRACVKAGKKHKVLLMVELGDLREGFWNLDELVDAAARVEALEGVELYGIGTNLGCYGSIRPTVEKMNELIGAAELVEAKIGRSLEIISGSATSSLPMVFKDEMPERINHLRVGEGILLNKDLPVYHQFVIEGLKEDTMWVHAEIIELKDKPTYPIGEISVDAFGYKPVYEDRGVRKRAILALGRQDIADHMKLVPTEEGIEIIGASSDHLILDITDAKRTLKIGDKVTFSFFYQVMLQAFLGRDIGVSFIE